VASLPDPIAFDSAARVELPAREEPDALRLVAEAEALGIPWRRVLTQEILAEATLQRFLGPDIEELPLWRALCLIPNSLFHSWRIRNLVDRLSWEASAQGAAAARRELAALFESLTGPRARHLTSETSLAKHYWFAYQRILELQSVALAAERIGDDGVLRVCRVCEVTGCGRRDAEWAVARATSPGRSHALDDSMARAREEGFEIPPAETEIVAFSRLRRFVRRHRLLRQPEAQKTPACKQDRRKPAIST
jgi:hypothetical protein